MLIRACNPDGFPDTRYIAYPFVLITVLLIAFIVRTRKDAVEETAAAAAPPAAKKKDTKKDDKPGSSKKKQ